MRDGVTGRAPLGDQSTQPGQFDLGNGGFASQLLGLMAVNSGLLGEGRASCAQVSDQPVLVSSEPTPAGNRQRHGVLPIGGVRTLLD